jgi:hypothetical protein
MPEGIARGAPNGLSTGVAIGASGVIYVSSDIESAIYMVVKT